jgi:hypothetical protein
LDSSEVGALKVHTIQSKDNDTRLHPPQAVGLQQGGSYSTQPAEGRAVETVHSRLLCDIENIKSSIASTKRKPALPSLLEKLRKRMISATTE